MPHHKARSQQTSHLLTADQRAQRQAQLITLVANGNLGAFNALYGEMSRALFVIVVEILEDDAEAEDVIQEVFLKIWEKAASFDGTRGKVINWAIRIAKNKAIDRHRRRKQFRIFQEQTSEGVITAPCGPFQETEHMQREDAAELRSALKCLPPKQRTAIELAFLAGLTHSEVSVALGQPIGTVKANIRRGLLDLRERMKAWRCQDLHHPKTLH